MKTRRKVAIGAIVALVVLAGLILVRAALFTPGAQPKSEPVADALDGPKIAAHLARAVQFATVSQQPPARTDPAVFESFAAWLQTSYPEVHRALKREVVGGHTLLYTWAGRDPRGAPGLLTAHYDVVPVIPGTEKAWKHPPFSGEIADGFVWGRGTLDDKGAVVTILEAVTELVKQGFQPARTLYLSFGHDEEVGGDQGAAAVAALLKSRGVRLAWSLDEGSFVLDRIIPGVARPVASINVAEKGYLTLELIAHGAGGHSALPPPETAVGEVARAVVALERAPLPGGLDGVSADAFDALARNMSFGPRLLFANRWLFGPLLERKLASAPVSNALLRTTTAPTMLSGGVKENVLPIEARATVNFRLHPRDTPESVLAYVKKVVADDRLEVRVLRGDRASAVASADSAAYRAMAAAARSVFGDVAVAPGITVAGTDSKHYGVVSDNAYRFNPMMIGAEDLTGFHGINERVSLENLVRATRFYIALIRTAG